MKKIILFSYILLLLKSNILQGQSTDVVNDYLTDEQAPGARAAMGIFSAGYGKALSEAVFDFQMDTWQNRLTSIGFAALGYQIVSYDTQAGLQFQPFKFNKEWKGFWEGYAIGEGLDLFLGFVQRYDAAKFIVASSLAIVMGIVVVEGQAADGFRMADDGPFTVGNLFTNRHSWWEHFAASGGLYWAISNHTESRESALLHTLPLIWLWEVKDGFLPWEEYGWIGGDGFSWRDGMAGSLAVMGSYAFDKWALPFLANKIFKTKMVNNFNLQLTGSGDHFIVLLTLHH
jgi:hypothetical protein